MMRRRKLVAPPTAKIYILKFIFGFGVKRRLKRKVVCRERREHELQREKGF
jgi:hypothetical protein